MKGLLSRSRRLPYPAPRLPRAAPLRSPVALVLGFAVLIGAGTGGLLLPVSARAGHTDPLTALFTATSAVCVTGLTVVDTATHWSLIGQAVILMLMEVGGLGFMIGATALTLVLRRRLSLRQRVIMREIGSSARLGDGGELVVRTILFTLGCEAVGTVLLWTRFAPRYGLRYGLWLALFHTVSAFTNGSFDLFRGHNLAAFGADPVVLLTLAGLIIVGGLSFVVVQELYQTRRWRRLSLDSRVVLLTTTALLAGGGALLFLTERHNPASLGGRPLGEQALDAFFHAAAARTCGFTTWDFGRSDPRSLFILLGLMFIGGAPGSMAGGVKLTTVSVILAGVWSTVRGRAEATLLKHRLLPTEQAQALAVAVLSVGVIVAVTLIISLSEGAYPRAPLLNLLFEVTSAFGTVGFSVGVTAHLSTLGKLLLIATMFIGRLGPVTVATALMERPRGTLPRPPGESVRIG